MGTFYKPSPRSDELYHYLYKRKYRGPSGDWIYVYQDDSQSAAGTVTYKNKYVTQNGTPIYERTHYTTNPKRFLNSETHTITASTDKNGNAKVVDQKTVEYGRAHVATMNLKRKLAPNPHAELSGAKKFFKWLKKTGIAGYKLGRKVVHDVRNSDQYKAAKRGYKRAYRKSSSGQYGGSTYYNPYRR